MIKNDAYPSAGEERQLAVSHETAPSHDPAPAYYMLVTVNPVPGSYYNIGGTFSCTVNDMLKHLISLSTHRDSIRVETEQARLRPLDADLQIPDTAKIPTTYWVGSKDIF